LSRCRNLVAAATPLLAAALAAAGCGLGPGRDLGDASLTVTRDFGARQIVPPVSDGVTEADTVMRVLERNARIETRYGGGFVQSIEGLEADEEGGAGPEDWFFYVDGVESTVGAAQYPLHGGEAIWWDYHDWGDAIHIPAVVGSYPQPFLDGYEGERHPVAVLCRDGGPACATVRRRLERDGVALSRRAPEQGAIRVLVGPWRHLQADPAAAQIGRGPQQSGVFAKFGAGPDCRLEALDEAGGTRRAFVGDAGLVAATRRYEAPPTWVVTGCGRGGVEEAARTVGRRYLLDRFAVIAGRGAKSFPIPLPVG
jgi:Domain of unknown function (DUF4430)